MQRYFIELTKQEMDETPDFQITGEDVHHIANVMRMSAGDRIICCSKDGHEALCLLKEVSKDHISCGIAEWTGENRELPLKIRIASGLPKGDKLEWIIQKGTELGASMFIPFQGARSVVKLDDKKAKKKRERWAKIAKEAAEQSYRNEIPEVKTVYTFRQTRLKWRRMSINVSLHTRSHQSREKRALSPRSSKAFRKVRLF